MQPNKTDAAEGEEQESLSNEEILRIAHEEFALCEDAEAENRREAEADHIFISGDQWDPEDVARRKSRGRPVLVMNKLAGFVRQVENDNRQNKQGAKVSPVDSGADIETAKILQGMVRHIEYDSNADVAYERCFSGMVRGGFGYMRLATEFESPFSFNQVIKIKSVQNPFSCFLDPRSTEPDGSDAEFGFAFDDISKDEFKRLWPESGLNTADVMTGIGNNLKEWATDKTIRVCDYYKREYVPDVLLLLSNGTEILESKFTEEVFAEMSAEDPMLSIEDDREVTVPVIKHRKITAKDVLEETIWPGQWIPIIPGYGEEIVIKGKKKTISLIRFAKDAARMFNYQKSSEAEIIALAPKAPWVIEANNWSKYKDFWQSANTETHSALPYDAYDEDGKPLPPPQRNVTEPPIAALSQASMMASDDIKATLSMYDAAIGNQSNETSGVAIRSRAAQAQTSNFHFADNLMRSKRHLFRQIVDLIPHIYDVARTVRTIGEDGTTDVVKVNEYFEREKRSYDLGGGRYDVTVSSGPSFETKRQEGAAALLELAKGGSPIMQWAPDLVFQSMDFHLAKEMAERAKKTLPPNLINDDKNTPLPPQAQLMMQQNAQIIEQLTAQLNEAQKKIDTKREELESKERIELKKLEVQLEIERAKIAAQDSRFLFDAEIGDLERRQSQLQNQNYEPMNFESQLPDQQMAQPQPNGGATPVNPMEYP